MNESANLAVAKPAPEVQSVVLSSTDIALASAKGYCPKKEFVLSALRATLLRVKLIGTELESAGVALKGDLISPVMALEWAEEVAPGCLCAVHMSLLEKESDGV
jgi:hypothetical protein